VLKDRVKTNGRTDGRTRPIALPYPLTRSVVSAGTGAQSTDDGTSTESSSAEINVARSLLRSLRPSASQWKSSRVGVGRVFGSRVKRFGRLGSGRVGSRVSVSER